jgi:TatD DNase family protein
LNFYIDTHCHLDHEAFDRDRQAVIERAVSAGVGYMVNPGVDVFSSKKAIEIAAKNDQVYAAIGLHPNDISADWKTTIAEIKDMAHSPKVVAIGEIGLDTYHKDIPLNIQMEALQAQLELASEFRLPVILHSRETLPEITKIISFWSESQRRLGWVPPYGVMHAFEGDVSDAESFINIGFLIGLGGPVTYKNATKKADLAKFVPLEYLLMETDCPYLPPVPYRGSRNEPSFLPIIGKRTAIIRLCDEDIISLKTTENAIRLFHFGVIH